jgi:hypothetical protein
MNQAFLYSLKVWLTTIGIAYITFIIVTFYRLAQPDHSKELDPYFGTIIFLVINAFFIPACGVYFLCVDAFIKFFDEKWKQKLSLNIFACFLVLCTFSPVLISQASDETYYPLAGFYMLFISISTWLYKPIS